MGTNKDRAKRIVCHHCGHSWLYDGKYKKNPDAYVTCPVCRYRVRIGKKQ